MASEVQALSSRSASVRGSGFWRVASIMVILAAIAVVVQGSSCPYQGDDFQQLWEVGSKARERRDLTTALDCYERASKIVPQAAASWLYLGVLYQQMGREGTALENFQKAYKAEPNHPDALVRYGSLLKDMSSDRDEILRAADMLLRVVKNHPNYHAMLQVHNDLSSLYKKIDMRDECEHHFNKCVEIKPDGYEFYVNFGVTLKDWGRERDALAMYNRALKAKPGNIHALLNIAITEMNLKNPDKCLEILKTIEDNPQYDDFASIIWGTRGQAHQMKGDLQSAQSCYKKAIELDPNDVKLYNWMAIALSGVRDPKLMNDALKYYEKAREVDPTYVEAYTNYGNLLKDLDRPAEGLPWIEKALEMNPKLHSAWCHRGDTLKDLMRFNEAIESYKEATRLNPGYTPAHCNMVYNMQLAADWRGREENLPRLQEIILDEIDDPVTASTHECVQPFMVLSYPLPTRFVLMQTERHAKLQAASGAELVIPTLHYPVGPIEDRRMVLGFVSADFMDHPVSKLTQSMYGMIDRTQIKAIGFAINRNDGTTWRRKIESEMEMFVDAEALGFAKLAQKINELKVHFLINLTGYTMNEPTPLFARKPAPIQAFFFGYLSTSGATYIDYYISDMISSPPELSSLYTEKLAYTTNSFFISDYKESHTRVVYDPKWIVKRRGVKLWHEDDLNRRLPEGFLFCNFNQLYKAELETFALWVRILKRVPGSHLWLMRMPKEAEERVHKEAAELGLDPSRVFFTSIFPAETHIKMKSVCDLYLDNMLINGHTTGKDVLWAGLPMITIANDRMVARVGASLATSLGTPEMIVRDMQEYEEYAVELANNKYLLEAFRHKVGKQRVQSALFDTSRWTRNFDRLVKMIGEQYFSWDRLGHCASHEHVAQF